MSHVSTIDLKIKSLEAVKAMCKRMGWEFRENQKKYAWFGRWVGDSPMPEGMTVDQLGKCDHAIHVPGSSYEIGLVKRGDHYTAVWDYWSSGQLLRPLGGQEAPKLKQAYAVEAAKLEARKRGWLVKERKTKDSIQIVLMR